MRWVVLSVVVHAVVLAVLIESPRMYEWRPPTLARLEAQPPVTVVEILELPTASGGGGGSVRARRAVRQGTDAWEQVAISFEHGGQGQGPGQGNGDHAGDGRGLGFRHVRVSDDVPPPPPAPKVSRARPAKLIWPSRDEEVDDEANLFVARVTVDSRGDVIGARMLTARPGAKSDRAASAIWTFRYSPALDDDGKPVNSTLDQSFQVR